MYSFLTLYSLAGNKLLYVLISMPADFIGCKFFTRFLTFEESASMPEVLAV